MAPASPQVETGNNEVGFAEELVTRPADYRSKTKDEQKGDEALCNTAPDHVLLADPLVIG